MYDGMEIRRDFPILSREVNGKPLVYLDNGASAQKPQAVIDAIGPKTKLVAVTHQGLVLGGVRKTFNCHVLLPPSVAAWPILIVKVVMQCEWLIPQRPKLL